MFWLSELEKNRWYWSLRYYGNAAKFRINRLIFRAREAKRRSAESASITVLLVRTIASQFILAAVIVVALQALEHTVLNLPLIERPLFLRNVLHHFILLHSRLAASGGALGTLLSIIGTMSGIFLGLYFTAVSVVASSAFAKVPGGLRELLLKERVGNQYIRILATLATVCLILLAYLLFGGDPGVLSTFFVVVVGCLGVLGFLVLGLRVFFFFDPTTLSDAIFHDLGKNVKEATVAGFRWQDPTFQAHYQKVAAQNISILATLVKLCTQEPQLQKGPLSTVLGQASRFLKKYSQERSRIPSESYWYARIPKYKSWFLQESSQLMVALETQTSPQPEMVPNPYWVEEEMIQILEVALREVLGKGNLDVVYETLEGVRRYVERLGSNLEVTKGRELAEKLGRSVERYYRSHPFVNLGEKSKDIEFAVFDAYGLSILSLATGFFARVRILEGGGSLENIHGVKWFSQRNVYETGAVPPLLPRMEYIQKRLKFEKWAEGKLVSPPWYVRQLVTTRYAELVHEGVEEVLSLLEHFFVSKSRSLLSKKSHILAGHHAQRGLEMCSKIEAHLPHLKALAQKLEKMNIVEGLPWPDWRWDQIRERMNRSYDLLVENIAKCIPVLSLLEHKENYPDLFGRSYNTVCQDCYDAMLFKNSGKFKKTFPLLFWGSIAAHDKLRKKLKDWSPETAMAISGEPLFDIMALSGYAKIYSELYELSEMWAVCRKVWDAYFESVDDAERVLTFLVELCKYRSTLYAISPRDVLRTNWKIHFTNKLSELNLVEDWPSHGSSLAEPSTQEHKSPLIRILCRGGLEPLYSATELFILIYLLKRPEAQNVEFKDSWGLDREMGKLEKGNEKV